MFIRKERKNYPIGLLCRTLMVSRSGYYKYLSQKITKKAKEDAEVLEIIRFYYSKSNGTYGLPRITAAMRKAGLRVNKKRIARLMKLHNIRAKTKRKFRVTTKANKKMQASENLLEGKFYSGQQDKIWTSDITYLWTREGWLYLAVIMDIYSRKIVGWSVSPSLSTELIIRALRMAIIHRNPSEGIILHSDRGSQYTSHSFRKLLKNYGIIQSMSSSGNCYDNAITESFFHTLKTELTYWENYQSREEAKRSLFNYIEIFYNRQRLHSALGYLSPVEFEEINGKDFLENVA
jgi:putative transposase